MNVIVFGACECTWNSGFVNTFKKNKIKITSFAFASIHPLSYIYQAYKKKNQKIIEKSDLIIVNVTSRGFCKDEKTFQYNISIFDCFYKLLNKLQKKILIMQWHHDIITGGKNTYFHKIQCEKYGFNFIDTYDFCLKENLINFYVEINDFSHTMEYIYEKLAYKIIKNISLLKTPKQNLNSKIPDFKILDLNDFMDITENDFCNIRSHLYRENILKIDNDFKKIIFPKKYLGMKILGIYTCNGCFSSNEHSCFILENKSKKNAIIAYAWPSFRLVDYDFKIDEEIIIHNLFDKNTKRPLYDEYNSSYENIKQAGIIGFLLLPNNENLDKINFTDEDIELSKEYDFSYLCEYLKDFKIIIEQYNQRQDPIKLIHLQTQITSLINEKANLQNQLNQFQNTLNYLPIKKQQLEIFNLEQDLINKKLQTKQLSKKLGIKMNEFMPKVTLINPNSAKQRIQNQLSYKLGQAMIINSKSLFGYIKMPFVLSYIKDKHNQEQKIYREKIKKDPSLKLPSLEDYPDYQEALKEKECLTYKLGQALIKANKTWYGGGISSCYLKLGS